MKQMVVIDRQAGNRTIFMPESFEINFYDFGDMLFVNFCKVGEIHNMFSIQLLFDNDKLAADINRIQKATGNDRYFCMFNSYTAITRRSAPSHLWRGNVKSDSLDYCFDASQLNQAEPEREVVRHFRR